MNTANGKQIRLMEDNKHLVEKIKDYNFNKTEFFNFKTSEGIDFNGY